MPNGKKTVTKNQQNTEIENQNSDFLESYVLFLADMNEFISAMKVKMNLTAADIKKIFSASCSNLKDTLYADTLIRQTLKSANDHLKDLEDTLGQIKEAQKEVERLEDNEITLNTPIPDFNFDQKDLGKRISEVNKIIKPLEDLIEEQENIDDEFAVNCNELMKDVSDIFKNAGFKVKKKRMGNAVLNAMNVFRRTLALERKLRSGEVLSDGEDIERQMPYMRKQCLIELLKTVEV